MASERLRRNELVDGPVVVSWLPAVEDLARDGVAEARWQRWWRVRALDAHEVGLRHVAGVVVVVWEGLEAVIGGVHVSLHPSCDMLTARYNQGDVGIRDGRCSASEIHIVD